MPHKFPDSGKGLQFAGALKTGKGKKQHLHFYYLEFSFQAPYVWDVFGRRFSSASPFSCTVCTIFFLVEMTQRSRGTDKLKS